MQHSPDMQRPKNLLRRWPRPPYKPPGKYALAYGVCYLLSWTALIAMTILMVPNGHADGAALVVSILATSSVSAVWPAWLFVRDGGTNATAAATCFMSSMACIPTWLLAVLAVAGLSPQGWHPAEAPERLAHAMLAEPMLLAVMIGGSLVAALMHVALLNPVYAVLIACWRRHANVR